MIIRRTRVFISIPLNICPARELKVGISGHPLLEDFCVYILKCFRTRTITIEYSPVRIREFINSHTFGHFAALINARNDIAEPAVTGIINTNTVFTDVVIYDCFFNCIYRCIPFQTLLAYFSRISSQNLGISTYEVSPSNTLAKPITLKPVIVLIL